MGAGARGVALQGQHGMVHGPVCRLRVSGFLCRIKLCSQKGGETMAPWGNGGEQPVPFQGLPPSCVAGVGGVPCKPLPRSGSRSPGGLTLDVAFDLCLDLVSDGRCFPNYPLHVGLCWLFVLTRSLSFSQEKKKIPWKGVCGVGERSMLSHTTQESYSALHIALGAPTHGRQFHAPWLVS